MDATAVLGRRYVVLPWGIVVAIVCIALVLAFLSWLGWDSWSDLS